MEIANDLNKLKLTKIFVTLSKIISSRKERKELK